MNNKKQAARSVLILIVLSLGSKLLGFIREVLIASKFGSGVETDTYFVALTATGLITTLIGASVNTTMIPILAQIETSEGKSGKKDHTSNFLNVLIIFSAVIVLLGWLLAPIIIRILASGFRGEQYDLAVLLMRIGLPVMFFSTIVYVFRGYLQSEMMFTESAAANFPFNFVYIFFLLFLSSQFGIKGLMVTSVLAVGAQILIQIPGIRKTGYNYKPICDFKDKNVKKILHLVPPVLLGTAINDLNSVIDKTLASNLVTGSISALNYAQRLNSLILGVFISAITTVLFPMLSSESCNDSYYEMKKIMGYGINVILLITIPATIGLIALSTPIVQIAFERGEFNNTATLMTSKALVFYSIGLSAISIRTLLTKVFYSLQDTKTPMINGIISVVMNIVLNLILIRYMAHSGLALATSIATTFAALLMFSKLKKKIGNLGCRMYIKCAVKAGFASVIMGIASYIIYHGMIELIGMGKLNSLISLLLAVGIGVILYLVLCYMFGIEEIKTVLMKLSQRYRKQPSA